PNRLCLYNDAGTRAGPVDVAVLRHRDVGGLRIPFVHDLGAERLEIDLPDFVAPAGTARHTGCGHLGEVESLAILVQGDPGRVIQTVQENSRHAALLHQDDAGALAGPVDPSFFADHDVGRFRIAGL